MGGRRVAGSLIASTATLATVAATVAACSDEPDQGTVDDAAVIAAVVEWQADEWTPPADADDDLLPVIYVVAADGGTIDVAVQAAVAEATVDSAEVRFADEAGESFDTDDAGAPVHDHGVLVAVGPIPEPARRVTVDVDLYEAQDAAEPYSVEVTATRPTDEHPARAEVTSTSRR